jgi:hypothetical protein
MKEYYYIAYSYMERGETTILNDSDVIDIHPFEWLDLKFESDVRDIKAKIKRRIYGITVIFYQEISKERFMNWKNARRNSRPF